MLIAETHHADPIPAFQQQFRLSVIIPNYNYDQYVGAAIESALAIDWPDVEIIVVDDGSTDNSRAVIEAFGSKITAIFQENASQAAAYRGPAGRRRSQIAVPSSVPG